MICNNHSPNQCKIPKKVELSSIKKTNFVDSLARASLELCKVFLFWTEMITNFETKSGSLDFCVGRHEDALICVL